MVSISIQNHSIMDRKQHPGFSNPVTQIINEYIFFFLKYQSFAARSTHCVGFWGFCAAAVWQLSFSLLCNQTTEQRLFSGYDTLIFSNNSTLNQFLEINPVTSTKNKYNNYSQLQRQAIFLRMVGFPNQDFSHYQFKAPCSTMRPLISSLKSTKGV